MDNLLAYVKDQIQPDAVMWTGDSASHDYGHQSLNETVTEVENVTEHVLKGVAGIPLYSAIGNHDAFPQDMIQANPELNEAIQGWAHSWDPLFKDDKQKADFMKRASYSAPLRSASDKDLPLAKVISLNTIWCYSSNYENMGFAKDPEGTL